MADKIDKVDKGKDSGTNIEQVFRSLVGFMKPPRNQRNWVISALIIAAIYAFFYGFYTIPILNIGFFKMEAAGIRDLIYIALASSLSALILTVFIGSRQKLRNAGKGVFAGGFIGALFGTICPACLGLNLLILGNVISIPLPFLVKYVGLIQLLSVSMLLFGAWYVSKSLLCAECIVPVAKGIRKSSSEKDSFFGPLSSKHQQIILAAFAILIILFIYQLASISTVGNTGMSPNAAGIDINKITNEVVPEEGFKLKATWGTSVTDMINAGVLDPDKLRSTLKKRYGQDMKPEWEAILAGEDSELEINADNSVFMMYMLWTFSKHNENAMLSDSPFAKSFANYDIGVGRAGYGDVKLLELTPEQQVIATNVAMNAYRPCCGNPTGRPDCSHGYSALGLVELMASQGFSEEEIFDSFVKANSFWFPATYIQNAAYFELTEGKSWDKVDKELVAGVDFSSLRGSYAVKQALQEAGI